MDKKKKTIKTICICGICINCLQKIITSLEKENKRISLVVLRGFEDMVDASQLKTFKENALVVIERLEKKVELLDKYRWIPVDDELPLLDEETTQSPWVHITDGKKVIDAYYYDYTKREAKPNMATGKGWCCHDMRKSDITHWREIDLPV